MNEGNKNDKNTKKAKEWKKEVKERECIGRNEEEDRNINDRMKAEKYGSREVNRRR